MPALLWGTLAPAHAAFGAVTAQGGNSLVASSTFPMPITSEGTIGTTDCGGASSVVTIPAGAIPAGRTLVIRVSLREGASPVSATDTRGNTYTVDVDRTQALVRTVILSANIQTPLQAGDTVTISHPDSKAQAVSVYRVAGLAGATRVAETASNGGSSNSLSVTVTTGGQRFLFAAATQKDNGMPVTQPSGWTNLNTRYVSCAGKALTDVGAFRIADAGTWIYTATSTRSDSWSAGLVGYRAP